MGNFSWFFSKSIKVQLTVVLFALTALAIVVVGFQGVRGILQSGSSAEQITTDAMKSRAEQFMAQTTSDAAQKNSVIFTNIQQEAGNTSEYVKGLLNNPGQFPNSYWKYDSHMSRLPGGQLTNSSSELGSVFLNKNVVVTPAIKRELETTAYMDFYAPQLLDDEKNVVAVYFIGTHGEARYYPNIGLASVSEPDFDPTKADFYTLGTPANNPTHVARLTNVYDDPAGNGLMVTVNQPVYTSGGVFSGVIGMDVVLSSIAKNIEDYTPIDASSYSFLLDSSGEAVALPAQGYQDILGRAAKSGEFGTSLKDVKGDFGTVLTAMRAGKTGFKAATAHGSDLYVAYAPVEGTPFSLGIVARQSSLLAVVSDLRTQVENATSSVLFFQILPTAAIILAAIWFVGYRYIYYLTRPLNQLTAATQKVRQGHFDVEQIPVEQNNEIGKLATAFNTMTSELSKSYTVLQKQLRELADGKAKDDAMISSIADGVIVTDRDTNVLLVNQAACDLFGVQGSDLINKPVTKLVLYGDDKKPLADDDRPVTQVLRTGKKVTRDVHNLRGKDNMRDIKVTASPIMQEGVVVGTIAIIRDVTREKEVDRLKTDFISVASHQLRTPLSAIRWFGEMLMNGDAGKLQPAQKEFVGNIAQSTKRMIELVGSLLNISRLESGSVHVEPKPTDLHELVTDITNDFKTEVSDRHQKLLVEIDPTLPQHIDIDPRLVSQVYVNLLNNAVRYTPNSGNISLKVMRRGDEVVSEVKDTGYGIPKEEQGKVFDRFFRGSNITKIETDGTGLGLYLVKTIVESSGGKVWFESSENKGTSFSFTLPILAKTK